MEQSNEGILNLPSLFDSDFIEKLSKEVGYDQRVHGPLKGEAMVKSLISLVMHYGWSASLHAHRMLLQLDYGVTVKEQSLNERFNSKAVALMKGVFDKGLQLRLRQSSPMKLLEQFTDVYLQDATAKELHPSLSTLYKGSGGGASEAGLKIGVSYSIGQGNISVQFLNGASSDTTQCIPEMEAGSLLLRDLGYFKIEDFVRIRQMACYILSRYRFGVNLYEDAERKDQICLLDLLSKMRENEVISKQVYVGEKQREPMRLIIEKVPPQVAAEKRRKLKTDKQNKRKNITKERLAFCDANCYLTNIEEDKLPAESGRTLYGLRWLIEILFKTWKSVGKLSGEIREIQKYRFMCLLYAQFIVLVINTKVVHYFKAENWNNNGYKISDIKAHKAIDLLKERWWNAIINACYEAYNKVLKDLEMLIRMTAKKRPKGKNEYHNDFFICIEKQT